MVRSKNIITGASLVFGWGLLGALLGLGAGYWAYVKTPATFAAAATIQVGSSPAEAVSSTARAVSAENSVETLAAIDSTLPAHDTAPNHSSAVVDKHDDRHLLISDDVLSEAVKLGRLSLLPAELRLDLQARRVADASSGVVYEIEYRGATPSSAEDVVNAVVASCQQTLSPTDNLAGWQESMQLLGTVRADIDRRIDELESKLKQIEIPGDAVLREENQTVISATAERWQRLRSEAYQVQRQRSALVRTLTHTETLIAQGASAESILSAAGLNAGMSQDQSPQQQQQLASQAAQRKLEERQKLEAERASLVKDVERELVPLQQELKSLLEKLGSEHPTVRHVRAQITAVRSKLDAIPPLKQPTAENKTDKTSVSPETSESTGTNVAAQQIAILLRAARMEKRLLDDQLVEVTARLSAAAEELARQEQALMRQRQLQREIDQQQQLREQTLARLGKLSVASPSPGIRLTVLRSASRGQQVSPQLMPHLATGGGTGLLAGFILGCLMLAYVTGGSEPE